MLLHVAQSSAFRVASPRLLTTSPRRFFLFCLPENSYKPYTLDEDTLLYKNRRLPPHELATLLKRGERSVSKRLEHITDVNTNGYRRLFCSSASASGVEPEPIETNMKLTKCSDVLNRIKFDHGLPESDFNVEVFDRVDGVTETVPFTQENKSVSGNERQFVFAIPEHRITAVYYRERLVWGREERVDLIKSIYEVIGGYDEWEKERKRERMKIQADINEASFKLKLEAGKDVWEVWERALTLLAEDMETKGDGFRRFELEKFITGLLEAVPFSESLSTYLSSLAKKGHGDYFSRIAMEIRRQSSDDDALPSMQHAGMIEMVTLEEKDIEESFVRGGGAGGQKVNKTASKVVLLHNPTGVRVACQKTRSLEQNRKIARKLLREKVDEFLRGGEARSSVKAEVKRAKKAKNKARSARRRRKKMEEEE
eukprot:CAMPEP_0118635310 /NCGR_PEP_ID=MMETSP0785-20121206/2009_1 /TAXON_ID=91992 /ORGANISM="Bolidomonas pacifica, Strain CCMP 1866" /LENGTH=425 /DNA_ID=CAMNT_0006526337 /DNA_START=73 /DNA_END=1350 /DNA_ORIENTATION=+